jgi:hypothetical protein
MEVTRDDRSEIVTSVDMISKNEVPVQGAEDTFKAIMTAGKQGKTRIPVIINLKSGKLYLMGK